MSTSQPVSLADAPAHLLKAAEHLRGLHVVLAMQGKALAPHMPNQSELMNRNSDEARDLAGYLTALASSLEQLQPAESNTNSDQVTITLSRKDAEWLMDISPAYRNINRPGFLEAWGNVRNATRAALHQPQPK